MIPETENGEYAVQVIGTGEGSYTLDSLAVDADGAPHTATFAGNTNINIQAVYDLSYDAAQPQNITIVSEDTTAPIITHTAINPQYLLNTASIPLSFDTNDSGTGIYRLEVNLDGSPLTSGQFLAFTVPGNHLIRISAEDFVGNVRTEEIPFAVVYQFSGFLSPIKADGSGIYNLGRTLPVKFQLTDANGVFVSTAVAQLLAAKIQDGIVGTEEVPLSSSVADIGNLFRYDSSTQQYIYNLATSSLGLGTWQLKVVLDDGKNYTVVISLH
ncbi:MAG: hypothetical protein A3A80_02845 [Candidatus Terrybacteria bacterium RIFCSPLOWO2_01_FULL_44_24]|uniref:Uncharacterized protein n=1 Tax=Candidatus Terrybacteria bacterium RIFCSPHIGHO2_01_FULL_43_35 TaxID=1802361 RepID=A0A1G2PEK2_9BACT|nr:MAG: hypothetical protein A2828_02635 [Candidatus Terrybacteria bacterium RIFCSPHIGHO2_01_FULL_43_35]OHA50243.1 MAG: hypothetical protein A3B75_00365 [Candidatus Terrybacteria bacterium RIFCSPHIGHO2_02_FULL_43_14]OHA51006.1 MAG: hypothetical protein A3A80_02845 [Candidatus Terrybacteria bacterium RIFCSPLOWO2_01_FULL_44_24]